MTMLKKERTQIFDFLGKLIENNNRDWFLAHKADYDLMRKNLEQLVMGLAEGLSHIEKGFNFTKSTDYTFRIYRDVRFSKDKSPYKNHIGIYLINGGRKSPMAGYYVHLQPGSSFVAGGVFRPDSKILRAIRDEIYFNTKGFESIVESENFKKMFGELWTKDRLKRIPRDFPKDAKSGDWLKYKSYIAMHHFEDKDILGDHFMEKTFELFKALKPFNDFLNEAILLSQED